MDTPGTTEKKLHGNVLTLAVVSAFFVFAFAADFSLALVKQQSLSAPQAKKTSTLQKPTSKALAATSSAPVKKEVPKKIPAQSKTASQNTTSIKKQTAQKQEATKPPLPKEDKKQITAQAGTLPAALPPPTQAPVPEKPASQQNVPDPKLPSLQELNDTVRKALVNVYCTTKTSGAFNPATGSGVLVDPRGVILTNAHVAQYFLLKDYHQKDFVTCFIRTGSPARITYRAELLYISQRWIAANPNINAQDDAPTGASDFALLRITERTDSDLGLPDSFPYLPLELDDGDVRLGDAAIAASYPAGFLEGLSIQNNLYLSSTVVSIKKLFGFSDNTLDLFSIGGSVVAQQGSSGGAVVRQKSGKLTGIITLSTMGESTDTRDLRALTLSHINRNFKKESSIDLNGLLAKGDFQTLARQFNADIAPALAKTLVDGLKK